jgi:hypothetical protein
MAHDQHEPLQELLDDALIGRKNNYQASRVGALGRAQQKGRSPTGAAGLNSGQLAQCVGAS